MRGVSASLTCSLGTESGLRDHALATKLGIETARVDPRGTTHSEKHDEVMKRYGLDKHMASAYIVAKKAMKTIQSSINL